MTEKEKSEIVAELLENAEDYVSLDRILGHIAMWLPTDEFLECLEDFCIDNDMEDLLEDIEEK